MSVQWKRRKEDPQKLTQLSSRSHPRHLVGKRTAQKDTIIDITSDSQVNSNFPYRWSRASLTLNNYIYLFSYVYITLITINNNAPHLKSPKNQNRRADLGRPHLKSPKNQNRRADLGRPAIKITGTTFSTGKISAQRRKRVSHGFLGSDLFGYIRQRRKSRRITMHEECNTHAFKTRKRTCLTQSPLYAHKIPSLLNSEWNLIDTLGFYWS